MKNKKEIQGTGFRVNIESKSLPFVISSKNLDKYESANEIMQKFIKFLEKKFDTIWYIGSDFLDDELYERFIFQKGGFLEISLSGKINAFFLKDKRVKFVNALTYTLDKTTTESSKKKVLDSVSEKKTLINLNDSIK